VTQATGDSVAPPSLAGRRAAARELLPTTGARVFGAAALAGVAVHALHAATGGGGTVVVDWLYCSLYALAAVVCVVHARAGGARAAWYTAAAGVAVWGAAEVSFRVIEPNPSAWYPALTQGLLAVGFTLAYATLVLLARARVRRFDAILALDGAVMALAATAVASLLLFPDSEYDGPAPPEGLLLAALMGLAFVLAVHALAGWRLDRLWELITLAIALNVVGDVLLVREAADNDFQRGSIADSLFVGSALLLAFAGFHAGRGGRGLLARPLGLPVPLAFAAAATAVLLFASVEGASGLVIVLAGLALAVTLVRVAVVFELLERTRHEALTDGLTGLGNRRKLLRDLDRELAAPERRPLTLALFDLDGFKGYNDTFGHPSGDALLALLADRLELAVAPGRAYRMGGDEFCAILEGDGAESREALGRGRAALEESGDGFTVTASTGAVVLHAEASDLSAALRLADARMYEVKDIGRRVEHRQTRDALLQVLSERQPGVRDRVRDVSALAVAVARRLGLDDDAVARVGRAAELYDIGKVAVPDDVLAKPGPLDSEEWGVVRQHTIAGERILRAAPSLAAAAPLVRASHERWDGAGYPDGLAGEQIPIGARIIGACDAYMAMRSVRRYGVRPSRAEALDELRRRAGEQFDPIVVDALCDEIGAETALTEPPLAQRRRLA
jgi:two-component system, cell cycle response regulator